MNNRRGIKKYIKTNFKYKPTSHDESLREYCQNIAKKISKYTKELNNIKNLSPEKVYAFESGFV